MASLVHRRTVFVVDDDAAVRDSLSLLLSLRGYATAVFGCAEDFLRVLSPDWRGCVVADIRMPGMSGLDLQRVLAEQQARLPVIVITGHGDIAAARQAFRHAAVDFLEKPFGDNRQVAEQLGISPRTVEVHKARVMAKLGARTLADLIRLARDA